jgi:hypothetical protein
MAIHKLAGPTLGVVFFAVFFARPCLSGEDNLAETIATLKRRLHTGPLRDQLDVHAAALQSEDATAREAALWFFHDIRAKEVFTALLLKPVPGPGTSRIMVLADLQTRAFVAIKCLDLFQIADLAKLHEAATTPLPLIIGEDEANGTGWRIQFEATGRLLQLLGLKVTFPVGFGRWTRDSSKLTAFWIEKVKEAKAKPDYLPELDELLKQLEARKEPQKPAGVR